MFIIFNIPGSCLIKGITNSRFKSDISSNKKYFKPSVVLLSTINNVDQGFSNHHYECSNHVYYQSIFNIKTSYGNDNVLSNKLKYVSSLTLLLLL